MRSIKREQGGLHAACMQMEYTPAPGAPFGRLGINRSISTGVHSPLMMRLALFASGETTGGVLTLDQNRVRRLVVNELRAALAAGCGGEPANFLIHATHAHNAPAMFPWGAEDTGFAQLDHLVKLARRLASETYERLRSAHVRTATIKVPGWAMCRRSVYRLPDGREQVGTHGSRDASDFVRAETDDETTLRAALFENTDGNTIGGFVNFACHPTTMYSNSRFSADYPGEMASCMEATCGGTFLALTGAAGDQSPINSGEEHCAVMGRTLAAAACDALDDATISALPPKLTIASRLLRLEQRTIEPRQIHIALAHVEALARGEHPVDLVNRLYGYEYHFHNNSTAVDDWLARDLIGMWEARRRSECRRMVETAEIQVINLGELAVLGVPCELFSSLGREICANSPFPCTMVVEQANGHLGYVPREEDFKRGGYECCFAQQSRLERSAGTRLRDAAIKLLVEHASTVVGG